MTVASARGRADDLVVWQAVVALRRRGHLIYRYPGQPHLMILDRAIVSVDWLLTLAATRSEPRLGCGRL